MSDLEHFIGSESNEADPQAVERMRERMKAAAAQMKKDQKQEAKQHKKEIDLADIIVKYLQAQDHKDILLLVLRCLDQNIPPVFVLAVLLLSEKQIRQAAGMMLEEADPENHKHIIPENALVQIGAGDGALPLKAKIELDNWIKTLDQTAHEKGMTFVRTAKIPEGEVKVVIIQLAAFVMREFLEAHKIDADFKKLQGFSNFILSGICRKIEKRSSLSKGEKQGEE